MKRFFTLILALLLLCTPLVFTSCGDDEKKEDNEETEETGFTVTHKAVIEIENYGSISLDLYGKEAPITVENFVKLAKSGFYNGLTFHRVIEGFMMQGGDPEASGMGGSDEQIKGEFSSNGIKNDIKHLRGTISMARGGYSMDSASSQFFIMHEDYPSLNGDYAAFGRVTSGIEVVDAICTGVTQGYNGAVSKTNQPVIKRITIDGVGEKPYEEIATHKATIVIKDYGTIELELYGSVAPITVNNFVKLAGEGFYDGLTFHRIIENFMMQGGDPKGDGTGDSDTEITGEFSANGIKNNILHKRGVISMARSNPYNSGSCQFFIMHKDYPSLDGQYAAFGRVTSGIEVVDAICVGRNGVLEKDKQPVITSITVEEIK